MPSLSWLFLLQHIPPSPGLSLEQSPGHVHLLLGAFLLDNSPSAGGRQPPAFPLSLLPRPQPSLTTMGVLATIPPRHACVRTKQELTRPWQRMEAVELVAELFWLATHAPYDPDDYWLKASSANCFFPPFSLQQLDMETEWERFFY